MLLLTACASDQGAMAPYFVPLLPGRAEGALPGDTTKPVPRQGPHLVSICYNSQTARPERIRDMVAENCEGAELLRNELDLGVCAVMLPIRALYRCQRISASLAEEKPPVRPTLTK